MADDRIYMQCNICGKKLYLGKQFGWQPFYWESYDGRTLEEKLNEFFEEHYHPEPDAYMWNGNFSIVYESDNYGHQGEIWKTNPANPADTVRHGHWKDITRNIYNDDEATCSVCGATFSSGYSDPSWWDYCPNCGAKME